MMKKKDGFSLVEVLVVITIMGIISLVAMGSFSAVVNRKALDKETLMVLSLVEQARNQTLSSKNALNYGVHFETAKAVLFTGSHYSVSDPANVVEPISPLVQISAVDLAGGGSEVVFNRLTGETTQNGTITIALSSDAAQTKTVTIFATGVVQSN